ncbi:translation initiation factor SUI1, partial [Xanthomonas oryzae]|uniref:translation initiation factor SUI1 n=1 Tax=Xanthomonas oryzae TaxID=347 RepID=UPI001C681E43
PRSPFLSPILRIQHRFPFASFASASACSHLHPRTRQIDQTSTLPNLNKPRNLSPGHQEQEQFMSFDNLKTFDPFADTGGEEDSSAAANIHIRIQQRNGRKTLTTVQGLPKEYDPKRILKVLKKEFATNGNIVQDSELGEVIQFQGDQRTKISEFIINRLGVSKQAIKLHGF